MLSDLDLLQVYPKAGVSEPSLRAARFAAGIARRLGARLFRDGDAPEGGPFYAEEDTSLHAPDPYAWSNEMGEPGRVRIALLPASPGSGSETVAQNAAVVRLESEPWESEATLFAGSGLAALLGDPARPALAPAGHYAAHCIGYAAFAAIAALYVKRIRHDRGDVASVDGRGVLAWMNWKAAVAGALGRDILREGAKAEWPILDCADGHVAFVYTERDWPAIKKMIDDPALGDPRFESFAGRLEHRADCMAPIAAWCRTRSKAELAEIFIESGVPGAPVSTPMDLLSDPLLTHREAFEQDSGAATPRLPHRLAACVKSDAAPSASGGDGVLPLSGFRILDFGIITAGAGVSALLADLGAEVIKVESETYPDPFRSWAGAASGDSPLFKSNNRNKRGIAIDLKTEAGKEKFLDLAAGAHGVVENFRRGVLDRLGLGFEALRAANSSILLASISGQGLDGPGANHTTFGSTLEASSGFAALTAYEDGRPFVTGRNLNYPDQIVCLYGAGVIAGALLACARDGAARRLDVSQRDCAIYQLGDGIAHVATGGPSDAAAMRAALQTRALDGIFRCADGVDIALTAPSVTALSRIDGLTPLGVRDWASRRSSLEAAAAFEAAGCGAIPVRLGSTLLADPTLAAAEVFQKSPSGDLVKGFPFQLRETPMRVVLDAPTVGRDNDLLL